ncbi:MAG: Tex family protein [Leadbetterella sp.]
MTTLQYSYIQTQLQISQNQAEPTIKLFLDGATVPFIARYRKEVTQNLNEIDILALRKVWEKFLEADKKRESILKSIEEQGKLSLELKKQIENALFVNELEEIYLPYKPKKKTRASEARKNGLEPLAEVIFKQIERNVESLAVKYLNANVKTIQDAIQGAQDIMAEWIAEDRDTRDKIRNIFAKYGILNSIEKESKNTDSQKFKDYFQYNELIKDIPSHRYLAIMRGEAEGYLKVKIEIEAEKAHERLCVKYLTGLAACKVVVERAIADSLKRMIIPSIETETHHALKEKADSKAIAIFGENLKQLLVASPLGQKKVLAIDPGFRTGCKTVVLSELGDLKTDTVLYLFKEQEAAANFRLLLDKHKVDAIAIGNGTASRETEEFVRKQLKTLPDHQNLKVHIVSEQGASIYSASEIAIEEFPNKDITVRGAVSIGRRLMDPLAELVKIDPKSIGVGQYQHDVDQKKLKESLDDVVVSCVNSVGVELNTASKSLLSYVSGIGPILAQNIVEYRTKNGPFSSRNEIKKVPRFGEKAFEQAAGFLRIKDAKNILDNTGVHPEAYAIVEKMAKNNGVKIAEFIANPSIRKSVSLKDYATKEIGLFTLSDIMKELEKPGRDSREPLDDFQFSDVHKIEDLRIGMVLPGIVTNITAFGCFVDIGVHQDGLVHLSQMANRFIKDPNEVVKVHQKVTVKITEVEPTRKRIALSMKDVG